MNKFILKRKPWPAANSPYCQEPHGSKPDYWADHTPLTPESTQKPISTQNLANSGLFESNNACKDVSPKGFWNPSGAFKITKYSTESVL